MIDERTKRERIFSRLVVDYLNLKIRFFQTFSQSIRCGVEAYNFVQMGKSSKKKSKQGNRPSHLHQRRISIHEKTTLLLEEQHSKLELEGRLKESYDVYLKHLQCLKNIKEDYVAMNRVRFYDNQVVVILNFSLFTQMKAQDYSRALNLCKEALKVKDNPMRNIYLSCIDLFLIRIEGFSAARVTRVSKQVHELIKVNEGIGFGKWYQLYVVFITGALGELNRLRQYSMVKDLSSAVMEHKNKTIVRQGVMFRTFCVVDLCRSAIITTDFSTLNELLLHGQKDAQNLMKNDETGVGYLAISLINFYFAYGRFQCDENCNEVVNSAIEWLEQYLTTKTDYSMWKCCACEEARINSDVTDSLLLCQECRVVCYCCKDCQRLGYLHHEQTRTRGLGHKHLCPVFKAFGKKKKNKDNSKNDHLERKFQRACKRFFLSTFGTFREDSKS